MTKEKKILFTFLLFVFTTSGNLFAQNPVASFTFSNPCLGTQAIFTSTSTTMGNMDSTVWNFGDPSSGALNYYEGVTAYHQFSTTGNFMVLLTVYNDGGFWDTISQQVTIYPLPVSDFSFIEACDGTPVQFTDLSSASPYSISSRLWSFGDLTSDTSQNPVKLYGAPNTYAVSLKVTASTTCSKTKIQNVKTHAFPIIHIVKDSIACENVSEGFVDQSTVFNGQKTKWLWTFSTFGTDTVPNPYFSFPQAGIIPVTLKVTTDGNCSSTDSFYVDVKSLPVAAFAISPQGGVPPLTVNFTNQTTGAIQYSWEFGNGNNSVDVNPVYTYTDTGTFKSCLVAENEFGCVSSKVCHDVLVRRPVVDLAVLNLSYSIQSGVMSLSAWLANYGDLDITASELRIDFGGDSKVIETITDTLFAGKDRLYSVKSKFEINPNDKNSFVCAEAFIKNQTDGNSLNNEQCTSIGGEFFVSEPFPNPVKTILQLEYILPETGTLTIEIFDTNGKRVLSQSNENAQPGLNIALVDLGTLRSGIYSCRSEYGGKAVVKRVVKY